MRWHKWPLVHALALSLVASGCASHQPIEWVVDPAEPPLLPLPLAPHVIADATPVDLSGFHLSEEEYERYLSARNSRVDAAVDSARVGGLGGFHPVLLPLLPVVLVVAVVATKGSAYGKASDRDRLIEQPDTARLARLLADGATAPALVQHTARALESNPGATTGWLQVRMKSIEQRLYPDNRVALAFRAEAQAIAPDGTKSRSSEHFVLMPPKDSFTPFAWRDEVVEKDVKQALDLLAASIASTYRPDRVAAPSQRYALQGRARVVAYRPGLREFVRDYEAR